MATAHLIVRGTRPDRDPYGEGVGTGACAAPWLPEPGEKKKYSAASRNGRGLCAGTCRNDLSIEFPWGRGGPW